MTSDIKPYILGITGASAQPLGERAIHLLLERNYHVNVILSKGAYEVWKSETGIKIPLDPHKQEVFWRKRIGTKKGNLFCHRWNNNSAGIASGSYSTKGMVKLLN